MTTHKPWLAAALLVSGAHGAPPIPPPPGTHAATVRHKHPASRRAAAIPDDSSHEIQTIATHIRSQAAAHPKENCLAGLNENQLDVLRKNSTGMESIFTDVTDGIITVYITKGNQPVQAGFSGPEGMSWEEAFGRADSFPGDGGYLYRDNPNFSIPLKPFLGKELAKSIGTIAGDRGAEALAEYYQAKGSGDEAAKKNAWEKFERETAKRLRSVSKDDEIYILAATDKIDARHGRFNAEHLNTQSTRDALNDFFSYCHTLSSSTGTSELVNTSHWRRLSGEGSLLATVAASADEQRLASNISGERKADSVPSR